MNIRNNLKKTAALAACLGVVASSFAAPPFSELTFAAASKQAGQSGKIVLVDFYTTWCGPCKLLDKNTWIDAAVIQLLDKKTVALRIDAEKEAARAAALAGLKRNQDGKDLAGQILKFDSSPATRTSLAAAAQRAQNTELAQYVKR